MIIVNKQIIEKWFFERLQDQGFFTCFSKVGMHVCCSPNNLEPVLLQDLFNLKKLIMNSTLKKLKDIKSDCCVTILLKTHRTLPENQKDNIELKNLVKEAQTRLPEKCNKEVAATIIDKINNLSSGIDHRFNQETLVLFVNEEIAEYTRLPIPVEKNKVTIGKTFATRDLIRAIHQQLAYYILVLSRDKARLIEASADKETTEITDGFPMENTFPVPVGAAGADARLQSNLVIEFFNRVDKQLNQFQRGADLPVFISTDEPNYAEYLKVADRKETFAGLVAGNRDVDSAHHIIREVWPVAKRWNEEKNRQRLAELDAAVGAKNLLTEFTEIWRAILEGRGRTLFVKEGYFRPAKLQVNADPLVSSEDAGETNVDDLVDEMIEKNLDFGGDAVFVHGDELAPYNGLVLVTRY
jgi:hypothetical protein